VLRGQSSSPNPGFDTQVSVAPAAQATGRHLASHYFETPTPIGLHKIYYQTLSKCGQIVPVDKLLVFSLRALGGYGFLKA